VKMAVPIKNAHAILMVPSVHGRSARAVAVPLPGDDALGMGLADRPGPARCRGSAVPRSRPVGAAAIRGRLGRRRPP